uniref:Uncharacterized protein n=1 Tax=Arundo donax TaxID=35708 RepID=A0A0A9C2L0_ARUDO
MLQHESRSNMLWSFCVFWGLTIQLIMCRYWCRGLWAWG